MEKRKLCIEERLMVMLWALRGMQGGVTITEWSRAVGLKRTPYFYRLAQQLVDVGAVGAYRARGSGPLGMWIYYLIEPRASGYYAELVEALGYDPFGEPLPWE